MEAARRSKILIIEDNALDREVYKQCLWQSDTEAFEFADAGTATAGIEKVRSWGPDCALLDVNLPDMDGIETLARLRGQPSGVPCAFIVLTAFGGENVAVKAMKAGAMDYLPKGQVTAGSLPPLVRNAIERFAMQRRLDEQRTALEASERRYQTLLEAMPQMVWTANAEGRLQYVNQRWIEYMGPDVEEASSLVSREVIHPDDWAPTWKAWRTAVDAGAVFEVEHRLRRANDGGYRWHLARALPLRNDAGEITQWLGTSTEIESQKQAEKTLREKQKIESIGRLAAGVAHDFNNLLVAILCGAGYAMEDLPPNHPAQEVLQGVIQAGERAAEITRRMLAYAGKGNLRLESADVSQAVQDALARAGVPKTIRVKFQKTSTLPPVQTDPEQLRQAVVDLVRNAVEAIEEGSPGTISVRTAAVELGPGTARDFASSEIAPGQYVLLEVGDNGCGMDEDTQKKVFDPFFTTKFAGRGLGLAAVHGFVRSSGGDVQVESQPGKGARVRVLLPAAASSSEPNATRAARAPEGFDGKD
ncbi:MAG TPA: ATP-binding protein [Bryobacteraceae bacterium]|jgi:PAS domain S-box-containing protein|nr:ATP-binding protein [Bryobacteraceae bacterium]